MSSPQLRPFLVLAILAIPFLSAFTACRDKEPQRLQGYIEGEYIYSAAPTAGRLITLAVTRGERVTSGTLLFTLDDTPERAAVEEARRRLAQAEATLADARKGLRGTELESIRAQLRLARESQALADSEFQRRQKVAATGAIAREEIERARSERDQAAQRVAQLSAELKTGQLGAREDQIAAAEANVQATQAQLARAEWDLGQKQQHAPQAGLVFDTLFREGEWVLAGRPIVVLLPPENMKLRTFVPEERIASFHPGDALRIFMDGQAQPVEARVSFISPSAEFTPPVIYSNESRTKLVYMIEARFAREVAVKLHPGQPVDVEQVR